MYDLGRSLSPCEGHGTVELSANLARRRDSQWRFSGGVACVLQRLAAALSRLDFVILRMGA